MSVGETLAELTRNVSELYKEIVTTSVRFDGLQRSTDQTIARFEQLLHQVLQKLGQVHDEHVREKAALEAQVKALEGRITALSEHALHAVARDAARSLMRDMLQEEKGAGGEGGRVGIGG